MNEWPCSHESTFGRRSLSTEKKDPVTEAFITFAFAVGKARCDSPNYKDLKVLGPKRAALVAMSELTSALIAFGKLMGISPNDVAKTILDTWGDTPEAPKGLLS